MPYFDFHNATTLEGTEAIILPTFLTAGNYTNWHEILGNIYELMTKF